MMNHKYPWILALGCVLMGQSECPTSDPTLIMPLGDSITDGYNAPGGYRIDLYPQLTTSGITVDFVGSKANGPVTLPDQDHEGHSGWRIDQLQDNVGVWIPTYQPELVILLIGTNDFLQDNETETAPERHSLLVETIQGLAPDVHIIVASLPPLSNEELDARAQVYNAAIEAATMERMAAGEAVSWVDIHSVLTTDDLLDGVHPNRGGYGKMADAFTEAILQID